MKKVLLIAYYFPPRPSIGARRPYGLAKYFGEYGWETVILTVKWPGKRPEGIRLVDTDYKDVISSLKRTVGLDADQGLHEKLGLPVTKNYSYSSWQAKIIRLSKELIAFPEVQKGWYHFALRSASELLDKERFDAMISTSSPITTHLIASKLKKTFGIPWIADFRDLWTQNHYYEKSNFVKFFERRLELKTLSAANAIVTSNPLVNKMRELHNNDRIYCITNGYDRDDFPQNVVTVTSKFTITYTGALYNGKRDPSLLLKVMNQLISEGAIDRKRVEIRFYCRKAEWVSDDAIKYNVEDIVSINEYAPREEVLIRQKESQLLLLLLWNNKAEEGILPGKVFEYIGARRPILVIGGAGGAVKVLLEETNAGKYTENDRELREVLLEYYREFIESGAVKCRSNNNIEKYTYKNIAGRYAELLNDVVFSSTDVTPRT